MDKVSKNAFIFCSIYGDAFCPSAAASFGLVWRNLARVAAVSTVGSFIIILGKLVVSFLTAGIAAFIMVKTSYGVDLSSPLLPGVVVLLLAYIISSLFMIVYETAIDTIFLCFLIDEVRIQWHCLILSSHVPDYLSYRTGEQQGRKHAGVARAAEDHR